MQRPVFWRLTIGVHGLILLAAAMLFWFEGGINPKVQSFNDALYWAIATATTVGYGDVTVSTPAGRWLAMGLMVLGTLFHALYTALFAVALMKPEIDLIERELMQEEQEVENLSRRVDTISEHR